MLQKSCSLNFPPSVYCLRDPRPACRLIVPQFLRIKGFTVPVQTPQTGCALPVLGKDSPGHFPRGAQASPPRPLASLSTLFLIGWDSQGTTVNYKGKNWIYKRERGEKGRVCRAPGNSKSCFHFLGGSTDQLATGRVWALLSLSRPSRGSKEQWQLLGIFQKNPRSSP